MYPTIKKKCWSSSLLATDPHTLQAATLAGALPLNGISGSGPAVVVTPSGNTTANADMHDISGSSSDPRAVVDMSQIALGHPSASFTAEPHMRLFMIVHYQAHPGLNAFMLSPLIIRRTGPMTLPRALSSFARRPRIRINLIHQTKPH